MHFTVFIEGVQGKLQTYQTIVHLLLISYKITRAELDFARVLKNGIETKHYVVSSFDRFYFLNYPQVL